MQDLRLPPVYELTVLDEKTDIAAEAVRRAGQGADPGTLVCADSETRFRCAVVVHPGDNLASSRRVIYIAALGLYDALGAVVPAGIDLTLHWPDRIDANAAPVARVGLRIPDGADRAGVPEWMVLNAEVALAPDDGKPKDGFFATTLHGEGCSETTAADILASFARHFLTWSNRWLDDGFAPVRAMWLRHAYDHNRRVEVETAGETFCGMFRDIGSDGAIELDTDGAIRRISLAAALSQPVTVRRAELPEGGGA